MINNFQEPNVRESKYMMTKRPRFLFQEPLHANLVYRYHVAKVRWWAADRCRQDVKTSFSSVLPNYLPSVTRIAPYT